MQDQYYLEDDYADGVQRTLYTSNPISGHLEEV